jgi:hypothetical protein
VARFELKSIGRVNFLLQYGEIVMCVGCDEKTAGDVVDILNRYEADSNGDSTRNRAFALLANINANVDNEKLSDAEFRQYIKNSLGIIPVDFFERNTNK